MKPQDMTDAALVEAGMVDLLCERFGDKEFVVERRAGGASAYVASLDSYDGSTEWTADPRMARLFRGAEWVRFWARPDLSLTLPHNLP